MNPFRKSQEFFRMKEVVAHKNGSTYRGYLERMEYNQRHIVLKGASKDGESVGVAHVSHVEEMYLSDGDFRVVDVPLDEVEKIDYSVRDFEVSENSEYVESVRGHGSVKSFPTVVKLDDGGFGVPSSRSQRRPRQQQRHAAQRTATRRRHAGQPDNSIRRRQTRPARRQNKGSAGKTLRPLNLLQQPI